MEALEGLNYTIFFLSLQRNFDFGRLGLGGI